jgi:hypothetical protein
LIPMLVELKFTVFSLLNLLYFLFLVGYFPF